MIRTERGDSGQPLVGAPEGGDDLAIATACPFCRGLLGSAPHDVRCTPVSGGQSLWPPLTLCAACAEWLMVLARDGRSARGLTERTVEGGYGAFLHGRLRDLRVAADVVDPGANGAIDEVCATAGIAREADGEGAALLFVEADPEGRAASLTAAAPAGAAVIVLASLAARGDLLGSLAAGAVDWLTLPVTPQQIVAALTRFQRDYAEPRRWDSRTALPIAQLPPEGPLLTFAPALGTDLFELSWLLRRFARGYDDLVIYGDRPHLLPRAAQGHLPAIRERFAQMLGERASVTLSMGVPRRRVDAAG